MAPPPPQFGSRRNTANRVKFFVMNGMNPVRLLCRLVRSTRIIAPLGTPL
jgi:hypothetical protein